MSDELTGPIGPSGSARAWAAATHLSAFGGWVVPWLGQLLFPLMIWLLKRSDDPFFEDQATEAVNFALTMALIDAVIWTVIFTQGMELVFLIILATAFQSLFVIIAATRAKRGVPFRYPICLRLL